MVHVTSVVQPKCYKNTFCLQKKDFIQQFFSRELPTSAIIENTMHRDTLHNGARVMRGRKIVE